MYLKTGNPNGVLVFLPICFLPLLFLCVKSNPENQKRPLYIIGHMANTLAVVDQFLREGANSVEVDVAFDNNGVPRWTHHGVPCDIMRLCHLWTDFVPFITGIKSRKMALFFLDLKIKNLDRSTKFHAGRDVATKLVQHYWANSSDSIPIVASVPSLADEPFVAGFQQVLKEYPQYQNLVAFDVSSNEDISRIEKMYERLNITSAWLGDGVTNWFELFRGYGRVLRGTQRRDADDSRISKVYRWTIDFKRSARVVLDLKVDAIMTNDPYAIARVLRERSGYRLATRDDQFNNKF